MNNILKFKKIHPDAVLPQLAYDGDAGYDLTCIKEPEFVFNDNSFLYNNSLLYIEYHTGLIVQPPKGFRTEIYPRSSIRKYDLVLCNGLGLIDNSYRGELICCFNYICNNSIKQNYKNYKDNLDKYNIYRKGDKIAQLLIKKDYIFDVIEVDELDKTERGRGNFGSTGI